MARFFWDEGATFQEFTSTWEYTGIDTFVSLASTPAESGMMANFNASTSAVIAGPGTLTYNLESGYQPAGEGFEYQIEGGDTYYYQPALKGVTRTWGSVTDGWSIIPCVIRLTMDTFELVDIIDLVPSEPTITNYRDASRYTGTPYFIYGLNYLPDFIPWGRIGDCVAGAVGFGGSSTGELHAILRINDWLIPQISNSNQMYAYNLADESYFRLEGWDDMPGQLLQEDANTDIDFEGYAHERSWYNVICPAGGNLVLIMKETQEQECSVVSDFTGTKTPEAIVGAYTVRDYFRAKWVNSTGTSSVEFSGDSEDWYEFIAYDWDLPDLYCGDILGEPWGDGPWKPPYGHLAERDQATTEAGFLDALATDLDAICAIPRFSGIKATSITIELQLYEFPASGSPSYVSTLYTWNDETLEAGPLLRGASEYSITSTTMGALPMRDAGGVFEEDYYVIDVETDSSYYRDNASNFSFGAGVMVHSINYSVLPITGDHRYALQSQDINNCPGPEGPALFKVELDEPTDVKYGEGCFLTVLETPITSNPLYPALPEWNPCHIVNDGMVAIFLPEISKYGLIKCVPLIEPGSGDPPLPTWEVNSRDYVDENISESVGACISNGVLTAQFLYLVLTNVGRQTLLKIRVYDALDEEEIVTEAAGIVVEMVDLTDLLGGYEYYRDPLVVVNRRLVGINTTEFFEITGTPVVPGSGS